MLSFTATATGAQELVAAPAAGKFIRVLGYQVMGSDSEATVQLRSNTTPKATLLTPATGVGGISCPPGKEPYFDCAAAVALNFNTGGASGTWSVNVQYAIMG